MRKICDDCAVIETLINEQTEIKKSLHLIHIIKLRAKFLLERNTSTEICYNYLQEILNNSIKVNVILSKRI